MTILRIGLVLALLAASAKASRADGGPPIPGVGSPHVTVRLFTREEFPEYLFILGPQGSGTHAVFFEVTPEKPFTLPKEYFHGASMLIVRRDAVKPELSADDLYNDRTIPGRVEHPLPRRENVPAWYGEEYVVSHRIQRTKQGDSLEVIRTTVNPLWQCCVVGIFGPIAIVLGGMWIARKLKRRVPPSPR